MVGKPSGKWYAVLALSAILAGTLLLALPGAADAKKPGGLDSARGNGELARGTFYGDVTTEFRFDAKNTDAGTGAAKGSISVDQSLDQGGGSASSFKGKVTCLEVDGERASLSGTIEEASEPVFEGGSFFIQAVDSGQPKGEGDLFTFGAGAPSEPDCSTFFPADVPIEKGNIVVEDAAE